MGTSVWVCSEGGAHALTLCTPAPNKIQETRKNLLYVIIQSALWVCRFCIGSSNQPWAENTLHLRAGCRGLKHLRTPHGLLGHPPTDPAGRLHSLTAFHVSQSLTIPTVWPISHQSLKKGSPSTRMTCSPTTLSSAHQKTDSPDLSCPFSLVTVGFCCGMRTQYLRAKWCYLCHNANAPNETERS